MHKRRFLQGLLSCGCLAAASQLPRWLEPAKTPPGISTSAARVMPPAPVADLPPPQPLPGEPDFPAESVTIQEKELSPGFKHRERRPDISALDEEELASYLEKIRRFESDHSGDLFLSQDKLPVFTATLRRLDRVERFVGHGNFNLLGFDEMLYFARNYEAIGDFGPEELAFMDEIFHTDAADYGFYGDKVLTRLNSPIAQGDVVKIAGSGHYLFKGESLRLYRQLHKDVGDELQLTSGVRNVVKQMHLFLGKLERASGNLSRASRSLAPPGYSYHGVGDFDVGKKGLGERNFTDHFSATEEFRRMLTLGYVDIRYPDANLYGVRYEPWHVKLAGKS